MRDSQEDQVVLDKWVEIQMILKIDRCRDQVPVDQEDLEALVRKVEEMFSFRSSVSV